MDSVSPLHLVFLSPLTSLFCLLSFHCCLLALCIPLHLHFSVPGTCHKACRVPIAQEPLRYHPDGMSLPGKNIISFFFFLFNFNFRLLIVKMDGKAHFFSISSLSEEEEQGSACPALVPTPSRGNASPVAIVGRSSEKSCRI